MASSISDAPNVVEREVPHANDPRSAELARLDRLLAAHVERLRRRGRGPTHALHGSLIEDDEAAGLLAELAAERPAGVAAVESAGALQLPSLTYAAATYGLSPFERDVLLLALAPELDGRYGRLLAFLNDHAQRTRATVELALAVLGGGDAALTRFLPTAPLVRCGLVELDGDGPLPTRALRLPDAFWPRLVGWPLAGDVAEARRGQLLARLALAPDVRGRAQALVEQLRAGAARRALVLVSGASGSGRETLALSLLAELGLPALVVDAADLPARRAALWREATWQRAALVVRGDALDAAALAPFAELPLPLVCVIPPNHEGALLQTATTRRLFTLALERPDAARAAQIWSTLLPPERRAPTLDLDDTARRFRFGPERMAKATTLARAQARLAGDNERVTREQLDAACRALPAVRLDALAQKLPLPFDRDDVIVPPETRREIDLALSWARHKHVVFEEWGIAQKLSAGRGLTCLFAGPPGTGKTMAAQMLARVIGLDLYRIDLSQVVSKYIGETEKNLATLFDEAQAANVILFFDEADALFGKRTEVKDAHDRYANVETGFLLQRMESHDGISILATNLRRNLDEAFLRRLHVVADFPMPGPSERLLIWQRMLPAAPFRQADIDLPLLAERFACSGGEIRNAVLTASFFAADEARLVGMPHLVLGLWRELQKSGRMIDVKSFGPWAPQIRAQRERPATK